MLINLKPMNQRGMSASDIIRRIQPNLAGIPGATLYMQPVQDLTIDDRVSRTQYQYSLGSPDATEVDTWTNRLVKKLQTIPELADVTSDLQNLGLQTFIEIDRDTASRLGLSATTIDNELYDAFGQRQISTMYTQRNQYHVILEALPQLNKSPASLDNIYLNATAGTAIPLAAFTHVKVGLGPLVVNRQGQFPVATISFNLAPGASLGEALNEVQKAKDSFDMPASVQGSFQGTAASFESSLSNEGLLMLAAIVVVYIVLGVLYESYIHPITILSTLPSACMGALLALMLFGEALTVIALIGIILLIGIVMKNAIMMIDFALEQERKYQKPPREAIYEACRLRLRPILMTTMASLLGAVPLAFGGGMGSELRQPLGVAIIAGLLVSQLLTLYTTPVIYLAFDRLSRHLIALHKRLFNPDEPAGEVQ